MTTHEQKLLHRDRFIANLVTNCPLRANVRLVASIRRCTSATPFNGMCFESPGRIACCGSALERVNATDGFVLYSAEYGSGVHLGESEDFLKRCQEALGWDVTQRQIRSLINGRVKQLHFPDPRYPAAFPVYELDKRAAEMAKIAGLKTRRRHARAGDLVVVHPAPVQGYWMNGGIHVHPASSLPKSQYQPSGIGPTENT